MSLDVEDRTEDIQNNNRRVKPAVQFVDPAKRCHYCGREGKKEAEPKKKTNNGFYLGIILGNNIDLTMSSTERFYFKKDYETFKLRFTIFNLFPLAIAYFFPSRPMDAICHFLMVWYYCTLTIRESILIINGSKLGSWWVAHHYLACVIGGVALTWPDDASYQVYHTHSLMVSIIFALCQQLQVPYLKVGCPSRRLHSPGPRRLDGRDPRGFRHVDVPRPYVSASLSGRNVPARTEQRLHAVQIVENSGVCLAGTNTFTAVPHRRCWKYRHGFANRLQENEGKREVTCEEDSSALSLNS
ncbi:hypothetical protein OSTOST_09992 [Ostertagia ostertagi]